NKFCGDGLIGLRYAVLATILYVQSLEHIPNSLLEACRAYAKKIVGGSTSKPESLGWLERIENEFNSHRVVHAPALPRHDCSPTALG
ncbi:hypothetical protein, partial [Pseudomonas lundensis]|uniref:hypothetical protein n=1 Tax=Pseudomonas lundensis TaxID=86185 RepID=UPI001BB01D0D